MILGDLFTVLGVFVVGLGVLALIVRFIIWHNTKTLRGDFKKK